MSENTAAQSPDISLQEEESILKNIALEEEKRTDKNNGQITFFHKHKKAFTISGIVLAVLLLIIGGIGFYSWKIIQTFQVQALEAKTTVQAAYTNFKNQNLPATQEELKKLTQQESELRQTYQKLSFYKAIPFANSYYQDGEHAFNAAEAGLEAGLKSIAAITPYADVLGFAGEGTFTGGTAEDRLKLILQTIEKISPILDDITVQLKTMQSELALIEPTHYPEKVKNQEVRSLITTAQDTSQTALNSLTQYRPIIEQLPSIMGANQERKKYLILFQNDNELRPTGGFLTAYATIFIEDGKVTPEKSDDIYELDKKFHKKIPIPEQLGRYLTTEKYWHLRDMNTSPDFKMSMNQFLKYYLKIPGEPTDIDGVITVDTEFLTALLEVLGPVKIPGYGTFSAENDPACDCAQVVHALSEIITRPTPYQRVNRKGILGPMMRSILTKAYSAPKQQWPAMFQAGITSLEGRDIQLYFMDENNQQAAEAINAAGTMKAEKNADFLAIVDANLGGAKSNLFVKSEVNQIVSAPENGKITKEIEITYRNTRKADNCNLEAGLLCLNSTLRDWNRLYLPKGSHLVKAQGFTQDAKEYDEGEFHVIDGFFILEPLGQAKLKLTYTVPYTDTKNYRIKLWKQGGVDPIPTMMDVTGGQEKILVNKDLLYETPF